MGFQEIKPEELVFNPFQKIGKQWMLISAGDASGYNTMTASWGGVGVLWGKPAATAYIRPQRYTKEFVDRAETFTLSFYGEEHRKALQLFGTVSGRDRDKIREAGFTPYFVDGTVAFEEAELILVCRKMFAQEIRPENILDPAVEKWYEEKDYHTMYISEIVKVYQKQA